MEFDVFGISELNVYWPNLKASLQFKERLKDWWNPSQVRSAFAFNEQETRIKRSIRQYGGTAQISRGNAALKYQQSGHDPRGLGRWTWQKYRGKDNKTMRIITAYRPNYKSTIRPYSVYSQHRTYFNRIGKKSLEPRKVMLDDLTSEIRKWKKEGDHIILMMDCNDDLQGTRMRQFLDKTGMEESRPGLT
jgi:hypothetical protein